MIDRGALTIAMTAVLVLAVLLGWVLRWIYGRLDVAGPRGLARSADMAARLHAAEDGQRRAEQRLARVESDLTARLAEMEAELASTLQRLATAQDQAEEIRAAYREAMTRRDADA